MDTFFKLMEGPAGRTLRVLLGIALIYIGLGQMDGAGGKILALAGVLPIVMGAWGPCLVHLAVRRPKRA